MILFFLQTSNFLLHTILIDGLESRGLLASVMFLSVVWTLILMALIHCRGSITEQLIQYNATFLQIYSDEETNSSTSWMA